MNPNLNTQSGVAGAPSNAVENANTPAGRAEKRSIMNRIASVSSGIFGKIKSVMPFANSSAEVAVQTPATPNLPDYKPVTPAEIAPKDTFVYQPPMAIPRRGEVTGVVAAKRSAPDLSKDLFAHLSAKPAVDSSTSAKSSVYPAGGMPRARVLPRTAPTVDYRFEYKDPAEESRANCPAPDLSKVFRMQRVDYYRPAEQVQAAAQAQPTAQAQPVAQAQPATPKRRAVSALDDANAYVRELDKQYFAAIDERRSRGIIKNLGLWATRIKENVISAVAPNYVMNKAYEAAQSPVVTPVAQPATVNAPVQTKPSFFSRLKTGYENAKATFFPKTRKLVTAAALAGAAMGLNASEQGSAQPANAQKTSVAYTAKAVSKTEARPAAAIKSIPADKSLPVVSPSANRPAVNVKPAPQARPARLSNTLAALNAPSLSATLSDSPSAGIGNATERVLTPDPLADITASINNAYHHATGFHNGIYRGYHGHNDGPGTVSRTSLCAR